MDARSYCTIEKQIVLHVQIWWSGAPRTIIYTLFIQKRNIYKLKKLCIHLLIIDVYKYWGKKTATYVLWTDNIKLECHYLQSLQKAPVSCLEVVTFIADWELVATCSMSACFWSILQQKQQQHIHWTYLFPLQSHRYW